MDDLTNSSVYRVTAQYDGSVSLLRLWQGAKDFGGRACMDDATIETVVIVLEDVPDYESPGFARESRHSCNDLIAEMVAR